MTMIRVEKTGRVPRKLLTEGEAKTADYRAKYDRNRDAYRTGAQKFSFDRNIYANSNVKNALRKIQNDKCCYCESKVPKDKTSHTDVEHFRPKKFAQQEKGAEKVYPGYYWLAYDWENLFLSCQICNGSYKKNFFPLFDPASRARSHHDDISREEPLLVNPGGPDDPRGHIRFHDEVPVGITDVGRETIKVLGLRRFNEDRRALLDLMEAQLSIIKLLKSDLRPEARDTVGKATEFLENTVKPEVKFSSMARDWYCENSVELLNNAGSR